MVEPTRSEVALPPLYVRLQTAKGLHWSGLVEADTPLTIDVRQRWECELTSPGGTFARGTLQPNPDATPEDVYRDLCSLFKVEDKAVLWLRPIDRGVVEALTAGLAEVPLAFWDQSGTALSQDQQHLLLEAVRHLWLHALELGSQPLYVESSDQDCRPAFSLIRPTDVMVFDPVARSKRLEVEVMSAFGYHTAYWGFLHGGLHEAAAAVAEQLISRLPSYGDGAATASADGDQIVAAAHAIVRFRKFWDAEKLVSDRLERIESPDARIMRWVLLFEKGSIKKSIYDDLHDALDVFTVATPVLAETLKLFYERLTPALRFARSERPLDEHLERSVRFVNRLASSTHWDSAHLKYRGHSPREPDPSASVTEGSKKNFADEARVTISARAETEVVTQEQAEANPGKAASIEVEERPAMRAAPGQVTPKPAERVGQAARSPQRDEGKADRGNQRSATDKRDPRPDRKREDRSREELDDGFVDKLVHINRVAKVVKGGRRFGFAALVVVGDQKGRVGYGHGKAREVPEAIRKAKEAARRGVMRVPLRDGRTLHHDVHGRHGAGRVILRAAPAGTGIIAGGPMRAVFETLGVHDVVAKSQGSSNPYNMVRATFDALIHEDSPRQVAARRNIKVSDLQKRRKFDEHADADA